MHRFGDMNTGSKSDVRVLIVGAGPVGLTAALALRQRGFAVRIVDGAVVESKRTYPAIVHGRSLGILRDLGVGASLQWRGHRVAHLEIHVDGCERTKLRLPAEEASSPGALTLPQDVLRRALTSCLADLGSDVEWSTRLVALDQTDDRVRVGIVRRERAENEELKPEWSDVAFETAEYDFVIGADGEKSAVRELLGIRLSAVDATQFFTFFDVVDPRAGTDAHLVIRETLGTSIFPLQGGFSRLSFQTSVEPPARPGPEELHLLAATRIPWYPVHERQVEWSARRSFTPALAETFGLGRVWLAGDAAHVTGPLGGQSLNVGMQEAFQLADRLRTSCGLDRSARSALLGEYTRERRREWELLLGLDVGFLRHGRGEDWFRRNVKALLQALPVAGEELRQLLAELTIANQRLPAAREARAAVS